MGSGSIILEDYVHISMRRDVLLVFLSYFGRIDDK
jgi:hypothetical protein